MKTTYFRFIVVLMSLALTGSICMQGYWLYNALTIKQAEFSSIINNVLTTLVNTELPEERVTFVSVFPKKDSARKDITLVRELKMEVVNENNSITTSQTSVHRLLIDGKPVSNFNKYPDTVLVDSIGILLRKSHFTSQSTPKQMLASVDNMKKRFRKIGYDMVVSASEQTDSILYYKLKAEIKQKFEERGITSPVNVWIYSAITDSVFNGNQYFSAKAINKKYKKLIRSTSIVPQAKYLVIDVENPLGFLYDSLWPQFLLSLVFTLIIIIVFFITIREILKQKKISEIKNDFINNMTHELKTPIATISLAADTAGNEIVINDKDKVSHYLKVIKQENQRMNKHVEKVLNIALTEKADFELNKKPVNINELILEKVEQIKLQLEQRKAKIELDLKANSREYNIDVFHFGNVILNLLDNAIKYSIDEPQIRIETSIENEKIKISIRDAGIGMSKEETKRIFEKFYRVHTGNIHNVKGFGLGLSYVYNIVKLHNGTIEVKSEKGEGSEFIIEIPNG